MNDGEMTGWHYATGMPVKVRWKDGKITELSSAPGAPEGVWIAPSLFDIQVNGYGGVDFQQDDTTVESLLRAARRLRLDGCARFLLTLITDDWPQLTNRLRRLAMLRQSSEELRESIAGWHIEGPFLSPEPGFCGAHNAAVMRDPTPEMIEELRAITGSDPLLLTMAPERNGSVEAIARAVSLGIKVSLGHTNASAGTIREAVQAGATGFTHLGNGCPKELDRHDNILWRVFEASGLTASLIPDKIHVSPALFRLAHRVIDAGSLCYTTDAMSAAGAGPGRYRIGRLEVEVGEDQVVRQPGKSNFAGSALRPIDGVFRAAEMLGCSWRKVWSALSIRPMRFMGIEGPLCQPGDRADFCLLTVNETEQLQALRVCFGGRWVEEQQ